MDEIKEFIQRRFGDTDAHWVDGNCYYFALILCSRFPELQIYYEPVLGHFVAGKEGKFYDAKGQFTPEFGKPILLSEIRSEDPLWAETIQRDCIN